MGNEYGPFMDGITHAEDAADGAMVLGGLLLIACFVGVFTVGLLVGINL
jgi:hypothetical protein